MLQVRVSRAPEPRAVCFDLENKPGAYWYDGQTTSIITAFGWKWSDERRVHTMLLQADGSFRCDDGLDDHYCCDAPSAYRWFTAQLAAGGVVYGHNIRRHDLPMLNAGLLRLQLPVLPALRTTDTCRDLPKTAGVSKSLENMAAMYGLPGKKLSMSQPDWEEANALTEAGIALARKRVVSDVVLQERLRAKLIKLGILKPARVWTP